MNGFGKLIIFSSVIGVIAYLFLNCGNCLFGKPQVPELKQNEWWGAGEPLNLGESISPFRIEVPEQIIQDLNKRLDGFLKDAPTPPLENQGFQYGFNTNYLKKVIHYWRHNYNWKNRQQYFHKFPHFKTFVNGLDVHFISVKPKEVAGKKVLPLLLLHGWPGSFREFYDVIPLLTTPSEKYDFVFHVIVPSLPGYGFSSGSSKVGMGPAEIAVVMKNLMNRLGFDKFYVQGGDWGSIIAADLGILYPQSVLGIHSNMCLVQSVSSMLKWFVGSLMPSLVVSEEHQSKLYPIKDIFINLMQESGYAHIQATKPDTIGTVLNDTPVGLAAYILEKFSTWTNSSWRELPDGGLTKKFTMDSLLDNVMVYWISGCITTSQRLYAESFSPVNQAMNRIPVQVPTVCARFPNELLWQTKSQISEKYKNLLYISDFNDGGHFAAFEVPKLLKYLALGGPLQKLCIVTASYFNAIALYSRLVPAGAFAGVTPASGMASVFNHLLLVTALLTIYFGYKFGERLTEIPPVPVLDEDKWFGSGERENSDSKVRPFKIQISDEIINDLNERLDRYLKKNVTSPLKDQGFQYGFNSAYLRKVVEYWRNNYQWRKREELLNRYPQYKTNINGLGIHFIHLKPSPGQKSKNLPLLLLHGWPSSVQEFFRVIPMLIGTRKDADFALELVIPSLPGFGFSDRAEVAGLGAAEMAMFMRKLMKRLGHERFYVAGGDWGAVISKNLGILYPDSVLGIYSNMCFVLSFEVAARWILGALYPSVAVESNFHDKLYPLKDKFMFILEEFGYLHLQGTKPDTIGQALEDSPAGLASYILEKFSTWTNPKWTVLSDGGLTLRYSMDDLLDNVMIYWVTNSITPSMRLYKETLNDRHTSLGLEEIPIKTPTACIRYEHEIFWMSKPLIQNIFRNIVQMADVEDMGHYPAFERPKQFSESLWNAFQLFDKLNR